MHTSRSWLRSASALLLLPILATLPARVAANDVISNTGYTPCLDSPAVHVTALNITYNRATRLVIFDVSGTSELSGNVTAALTVTAYGVDVYNKTFNPCDDDTYVQQLCPVPTGTFTASGTQVVPEEYATQIPSIAFQIPDLGGQGKLQLFSGNSTEPVACVESVVGNGKTTKVAAVQYAAAGMAGAALVLSGVSAMSAVGAGAGATASGGGGGGASPTFTEVFGWFQGMAVNGMMSVQYPGIYRSFTQNFAFAGGLVYWEGMQNTIDSFRARTGGNLTHDSVAYLQNSTLVYATDVSKRSARFDPVKRLLPLLARQVTTTINGTTTTTNGTGATGVDDPAAGGNLTQMTTTQINTVSGIRAYVEELSIPESNTFMTVLLFFAIVIAAIVAGILLFKVILETWALFGTFPKKWDGFRQRFWWSIAKTITSLILVLYSVWVMYCVYQFKIGDSWAAKVLAGVTLGLFTAILIGFTVQIWRKARLAKQIAGDTSALYEDKEVWVRYSIFYDNYKRSFWWLFVPIIVYMAAKGIVIASLDGHGLAQCAGQLVIDSLLLLALLFLRPYQRRSGNWINITIQVVRVISIVCILVFVEELGITQTTQTIVGVVLIVIQAVLTAVLAILIAVNALVNCFRLNPHRKARKEAELAKQGDNDELTPLDAHNSWLMGPMEKKGGAHEEVSSLHGRGRSLNGLDYDSVSTRDATPMSYRDPQRIPLAAAAAHMGRGTRHHHHLDDDRHRSISPDPYAGRQPQLPDLEYTGRGIGSAL